MTMNLTTISEENVEESAESSDRDMDFMFVEADPWKPAWNVPATPMLWDVNDMPDTSGDYDVELYGDGES
uniref:Uncharacterized protein n=1 Tax=Moniliophthora roreri TaxID=221103 RepID=A0A0W0GBD7_MONRR